MTLMPVQVVPIDKYRGIYVKVERMKNCFHYMKIERSRKHFLCRKFDYKEEIIRMNSATNKIINTCIYTCMIKTGSVLKNHKYWITYKK